MTDYKRLYEAKASFATLTLKRLDYADVVVTAARAFESDLSEDCDGPEREFLRESLTKYDEMMS